MVEAWAVCAVAVLAAGGAAAQDQAPDWLKRPTAEDFQAAWPSRATKGGEVVLRCGVAVTGVLIDCMVQSETPKGQGLGAAALLLTPHYLMRPARRGGVAVPGTVTIPIGYAIHGNPDPGDAWEEHFRGTTWLPWAEAPSAADVARAYPATGKGAGHVVLRCRVRFDGHLSGCETSTETPAGQGFGHAALSLAPRFQVRNDLIPPRIHREILLDMAVHFSPPGEPPSNVAQVDWMTRPDPARVAALFPAAAVQAKVEHGRAVAACDIAPDGGLTGCAVAEEAPAGLDFGPAVATLASSMRVNLWTRDGMATAGARIRVPITLRMADAPPPSPTPASTPTRAPTPAASR